MSSDFNFCYQMHLLNYDRFKNLGGGKTLMSPKYFEDL